jgi:UDP-2,3-diacylglucosamine pyrophosphatase LpxH
MIKDATIIVSDLHADTWTNRAIGSTGKSKKEQFFELLDWAARVGIRELVINGDLMDLPPYQGQQSFPAGPSIAREVVERLVQFAHGIPVTYVMGNHDIGISGFRSMGRDSISGLRNANFCYPAYTISYPGTTILVEHGHFCDPALVLYLRDLANRTYRASQFEEFHWAMQRRSAAHPEKPMAPGCLEPVVTQPGENAYYAARRAQQVTAKPGLWARLCQFLKARLGRGIAPATMEWWWQAALQQMQEYLQKVRAQGQPLPGRLYQIYGHTHHADPRDAVSQEGVACIYINSGTWTEQVDQGWYLDVHPDDGTVWLQDWINEPEELRRLGVP